MNIGTQLAGIFLSLTASFAIWIGGEPAKVPIERVISNLQVQVVSHSTNAALLSQLARAHSMAYGLKTEQIQPDGKIPNHDIVPGQTEFTDRSIWTLKRQKPQLSFYDMLPDSGAPDASTLENLRQELTTPEQRKSRISHLTNAIHFYQKSILLNPTNAFTHLGLGWCLQENGETNQALTHYRKAITLAGTAPPAYRSRWTSFAAEVSCYALPLLDPQKDRAEWQRLSKLQEEVMPVISRRYSPIIIPLTQHPQLAECLNPNASIRFDLDGNGPALWTWITPACGWLVYDHDRAGLITSGLQLFGNVTFWLFWENGYEPLASLDDDQNGILSGSELTHLSIWHDSNSNGFSDPGEVQPLDRWDIVALDTNHQPHETALRWNPRGIHFRDGTTRPSFDILLEMR